jgi:hypothetical protein
MGGPVSVPVDVVAGAVAEQELLLPACPYELFYLPLAGR